MTDGMRILFWVMRCATGRATGNQLYHADRFFYSSGELRSAGRQPGTGPRQRGAACTQRSPPPKTSRCAMFYGGETCYLMTADALPVVTDTDEDGINNFRETVCDRSTRMPIPTVTAFRTDRRCSFCNSNLCRCRIPDGDGRPTCEIGSPYAHPCGFGFQSARCGYR